MTGASIKNDLAEIRRRNLEKAVAYHGHLCVGQVLGVHLSEKGLEAIQTDDPKNMIVFVENDRCIADTIQILTGTRLGRRTMKLVNYGKMAATFVNLQTQIAYRIWVSGNLDKIFGDVGTDKFKRCEKLLLTKSEDVVSLVQVSVIISPDEMPGKPRHTILCSRCGEKVMDAKEIYLEQKPLCLACAKGAYYTKCS
jgi:formylmethanofuran dehydrogenase subunit E